MDETISLQKIFEVIKKRFFLILFLTIITVSIVTTVSYYILTPIYSSKTQFIVNESRKGSESDLILDQNTIRTNVELINTYNVIIKSSAILDDVISELNLPYSMEILSRNIQVSSEQDSQVVTVVVKDSDPKRATEIANTTVHVFQNKISDIMNVDNVNVLSKAVTKEKPIPVEPKPILNIAIAIVLGMMLGVGLAFLLEYLDTKLHKESEIQEKLNVPVLGVVPTITKKDVQMYSLHVNKLTERSNDRVQTKETGAS